MTLQAEAAPATVADTGPLTIDQAVERQLASRKSVPAPEPEDEPVPGGEDVVESPEGEGEATVTDENSEADTQPADDGEGEPTEATADAGEADKDEPAKPTLDPPQMWDAEGKALFATLPPKAQEIILAREKLQQAEITKAQQKSAEITKVFETRIQHLEAQAETIGEYVDTGTARMQWWDKRMVEWDNWFAGDEARELAATEPAEFRAQEARYRQEQAKRNTEQRNLEKVRADKAKAEAASFKAFAEEQARLIPELIPELADEKEGPKRKQELFTYLRESGFEPDRIKGISAKEAQIAWKARQFDGLPKDLADRLKKAELYDKSMALAKKPPPPKPKVNAGPTAPAAGQGQRPSSDEARLKALNAKTNWSQDDHVEFMRLKAKVGK